MNDREQVIQAIRAAFGANVYPGDPWLVGSREGCEPEEEVGPFRGRTDWQALDAAFLDRQPGALHFFSEAGLRFFLPAYLIADLRGQLTYAEPLFTVTHGFSEVEATVNVGGRDFVMRSGRSAFVNPRRYGAARFEDHARFRLSVFTREEAGAIVQYLEYKRANDGPDGFDRPRIDDALNLFWRQRAASAPLRADLDRQEADLAAYLRAVRPEVDAGG